MADRGAGQPKTMLTPSQMEVGYGQTLSSRGNGNNNLAGWFGPLTPLAPIAPEQVTGRQWDFLSGYNITTRPRTYEPISFIQLRALAYSYDLLRLVIETRKDQIERIKWTFRSKEGKNASDATVQKVTDFFYKPDGEHDFVVWLRALIEDLLVIDAPTIWKERNRGGQLIGLHWLDGATIKPVIDDWGRTPRPYTENGQLIIPPAYQQILKGYPAIDYTADELIYKPRNLRTSGPYGYGPVEQIVMTVNIALRRQLHTLDYYTSGNIPESLIGVPTEWTPDQIKNFQDYWDAYFEGDLATRRKAKFVPGGVAKTFIQTKEPELKNVFDEWLARLVCYAFNVSPQALVSQQNRATANTQKELAEEEGLHPLLMWVTRLINGIIEDDLGIPDVELAIGDDTQIAPTDQKDILVAYSGAAILTKNEVRVRLGEDAVDTPEADQLGYTTANGFVPLDNTLKPAPIAPLVPVGPDGKPVQPKLPFGNDKATGKQPKETNDKEAKNPDSNKDAEKLAKDVDASGHNHGTGGRFAPLNDGMTPAERRRARRRAKNGVVELPSGRIRDKAGNVRSADGTFIQGAAPSTKDFHEKALAVAKKAAIATATTGAVIAAAYATGGPDKLRDSKVGGIAFEAAKTIVDYLFTTAAEEGLSHILDAMGIDKNVSSTVIKTIITPLKDYFTKVSNPIDDVNEDEFNYALELANKFMPIMIETFFEHLEDYFDENHPDLPEDGREALSDMLEQRQKDVTGVILGKCAGFFDLEKDWDESKHPRDAHGRFGSGGSKTPKPTPTATFTRPDIQAELPKEPEHGHWLNTLNEDTAGPLKALINEHAGVIDAVNKAWDAAGDYRNPLLSTAITFGVLAVLGTTAAPIAAALAVLSGIGKYTEEHKHEHTGTVIGSLSEGIAAAGEIFPIGTPPHIAATLAYTAVNTGGTEALTAVGVKRSTALLITSFLTGKWAKLSAKKIEEAAAEAAKVHKSFSDNDLVAIAFSTVIDMAFAKLKAALPISNKADEAIVDHFLAHVKNEVMNDLMTTIADMPEASNDASKTLDALFTKAARRFTPLPFARAATRTAHKAVVKRVTGALKVAWGRVEPALRVRLASDAEKLAKADDYDLSSIDSIDISDDLSPLVSDSAISALAQVGPDSTDELVDSVNNRAVNWAQKQAAALVGKKVLASGEVIDNPNPEYSITDTTRELIKNKIALGLANNIGTQAIIDSIEEEGFSNDRAELIAQTEIGNANSAGALIGYQGAAESGINVKKAWLTTGDAKVDSDICRANEEQGPIDLDEDFQSGHKQPLGHPRCRCSLVPVVIDSIEE
jgi:hypothetical protein